MINFAMFHQLIRSWVGKELKQIMQDDGFNNIRNNNVTFEI